MPYGEDSSSRALRACISCSSQKRKCDRALPKCSKCKRTGRPCSYFDSTPVPTPRDFRALQQKVNVLEHRIGYSNGDDSASVESTSIKSPMSSGYESLVAARFPSVIFLDAALVDHWHVTYERPHRSIPSLLLEWSGDSCMLNSIAEMYFSTTHRWLPMISKVRWQQLTGRPVPEPDVDKLLLSLCMKLTCERLPPDISASQLPLYEMVKSCLAHLEAKNLFSLSLIQAAILIAVFEVGHAIYPAAYISIGHCATLGHAIGLHEKKSAQMLPKSETWVEQEERRRVWWAVVILDRLVNLGTAYRPLITDDPRISDFLPVDDAMWDLGTPSTNDGLAVSASPHAPATPFARTAQASHLLGRVIRHLNDTNMDARNLEYRFADAIQFHQLGRTLLASVSSQLGQSDTAWDTDGWTAVAICYSALMKLYDAYSCTETAPGAILGQPVMQKAAIEGLRDITREIALFSSRLESMLQVKGIDSISPFVCDCIYAGLATSAWYVRENGDQEASTLIVPMKSALNVVGRRWGVAQAYLDIVYEGEMRFGVVL